MRSSFQEHQQQPPMPPLFSQKRKHQYLLPVPIVGGYTLENGVLTARTYNCGIDLEDLDMEAKVHWDGNTPQLLILGAYPDTMCRALFTGEFTLDLTQFIHDTPPHILDRLQVVTNPQFR
ncbi:hypothetical protein VIBNIWn13_p0121 [Vibrio nigripulchritudo Wn13]|nr:hypothetical protein VIBNIBLFn1_p0121 [Vibrio nigripulchritudo BLFn1]CCN97770.1 hypothetical protein VIBNIENn2_p0120 [Vibrio nigripulchritudo ENn2]CCO56081.1 hypothetical protein VIBNIWn13_p0121 [Vibrio nigripulchritudo Wn13]